jgi:hypothetical protein
MPLYTRYIDRHDDRLFMPLQVQQIPTTSNETLVTPTDTPNYHLVTSASASPKTLSFCTPNPFCASALPLAYSSRLMSRPESAKN